MNAGMKNGINLLMILVLFISCVQEKEDNNVLRRVEACMELFPDSALSLLSQIECPECMRGQQRADYALLLTQALDKNYLDNLQSDSLIMIAVEYYKQEGDKLKAGKAYFYYGKGIEQNCCVMSRLLEIIMQLLIDMLVELQNWRM